jgi:hypothetical protein
VEQAKAIGAFASFNIPGGIAHQASAIAHGVAAGMAFRVAAGGGGGGGGRTESIGGGFGGGGLGGSPIDGSRASRPGLPGSSPTPREAPTQSGGGPTYNFYSLGTIQQKEIVLASRKAFKDSEDRDGPI